MQKYKPMIIDGVRVFFIMGTGDLLAQTLVAKKSFRDVDWKRTAKFASIGLFFLGPALNVWYSYLDNAIAKNQKPLIRGLKKMALDQTIAAPSITLVLMTLVGAINKESPKQIKDRIRSDYFTIMSRNYLLWPAAQTFNFSMVPMQYQVTFAQTVAVIWNCYLSMMLNK